MNDNLEFQIKLVSQKYVDCRICGVLMFDLCWSFLCVYAITLKKTNSLLVVFSKNVAIILMAKARIGADLHRQLSCMVLTRYKCSTQKYTIE